VLGLPYGFFLALVVGIAVAAVVAVGTEKLIYEPRSTSIRSAC